MKPALAAALLGAISVVVTDKHGRPVPPNDPHDTLAVTQDSAVVPKSPPRATLPGRVSFALKFVMPGEQVPLEAVLTDSTVRLHRPRRGWAAHPYRTQPVALDRAR